MRSRDHLCRTHEINKKNLEKIQCLGILLLSIIMKRFSNIFGLLLNYGLLRDPFAIEK